MLELSDAEKKWGIDVFISQMQLIVQNVSRCVVVRDEWVGGWNVFLDPFNPLGADILINIFSCSNTSGGVLTCSVEQVAAGELGTNFLWGEQPVATIVEFIESVKKGRLVEYHWRNFTISRLSLRSGELSRPRTRKPIIGLLARLKHVLSPTSPREIKRYEPWRKRSEIDAQLAPVTVHEGEVLYIAT